ncbi:MAG: PAS domain-containing protein [Pseudomonadota bacterium]|nr:PAS domain-containing protein [Pseudomonadota bacterium]
MKLHPSELRVVLLPTPLDGEVSGTALADAGFDGVVCPDLPSLCDELARGVGVAILTEEAMEGEGVERLTALLADQPLWSDIPIILLTRALSESSIATTAVASLGNVTLLERPVRLATLVSTLRSALRARTRQLQVREHVRARDDAAGALRMTQARLDLVLSAADAGTWYCDLPPTEFVGNRAYRRHLGLNPDDTLPIDIGHFFSLVHAEDRAHTQAAIAAAIADGSVLDIDYRTCGPDGTERWVRAGGRTLFNRDGVPAGFYGTTIDLTARRAADSALARSEARFGALGEALPFGAWECDASGRVIHLAPAFLRLVDRDLPTCREHGWADLVHPDDRERFVEAWPRLFANPVMFDHEYRIRDQAGDYHTVLMRGMPLLDEASAVTTWAGINLDVTEKRQVERELERVDRLESVSLVAGGIAHDFNNLLTAILGNIALARMTAHRDQEVVRRLLDAERAGKQAQELARQLLAFARGSEPVRAPVWLPGLLRDAAEFALQGLGVRCDFYLAENLPGVEGDAGQLGQVVQNLVLHGATAMNGEGVLVIRASTIQVGAAGGLPFEPGPYVMVSVTDRGRGIARGDLSRVFDLVHSAKTRAGIALPIAHAIIRRHGGHLLAASQPQGSTFTFYLPAGAPIAQPQAAPPAPRPTRAIQKPPTRGRGRLLVMDDDAQVRAVAYLSLVRLGYQVTLAMHGVQALETYRTAMWEHNPYQVVFLDLTVQGGMGGRETLRRLQEIDAGVRAIAVTGYTDDPLLATFAAHGFAGAITKPYTVDDLSRVLELLARPADPDKTAEQPLIA